MIRWRLAHQSALVANSTLDFNLWPRGPAKIFISFFWLLWYGLEVVMVTTSATRLFRQKHWSKVIIAFTALNFDKYTAILLSLA
jgi:hypothetical protein